MLVNVVRNFASVCVLLMQLSLGVDNENELTLNCKMKAFLDAIYMLATEDQVIVGIQLCVVG